MQLAYHIIRHPPLCRVTGSGRNDDVRWIQRANFIERNLVIAKHAQRRAEFAEILHEVISERIVIVYDENHFCLRREWRVGSGVTHILSTLHPPHYTSSSAIRIASANA